jgi:predicted NAD-dependent protein-ADP-ribosyltransferase YbiA (DUF1768 family)
MKTILKSQNIILIPENEEDQLLLQIWEKEHENQVFMLKSNEEHDFIIQSLGLEKDVRREPINIANTVEVPFNLLSNFAQTPFVLDGLQYQSVEGFWQSLKFEKNSDRRAVAQLWGGAAKKATKGMGQPERFEYMDKIIRAGTHEHHALMYAANFAKFTQNEAAKAALLATNDRPIEHKMRRDSLTIPGAIMGDIWMRVREEIAERKDIF